MAAIERADTVVDYDAVRAKAHAQSLADLGPRVAGTGAEAEAADYVIAELESYGLPVSVEPFTSFGVTSAVVVATIEGSDPDAGLIYLGAHYDSVSGSPGGNDNGSGLGTLLEIARVTSSQVQPPTLTIKFLAFGAEEAGLLGSNYYVNNHRDELSQAAGMINLDMVGVGDGLALGTIGVAGTALRDDAGELATALGLDWVPFVAGDDSDHAPFEHAGVQAVFVYQYEDPYHHTSNDTAERLDLDAMQQNGVLAAQVLWQWAGQEGELAATPTATATITGTATATATKAATAIGGASYYGWLPYVARDVIGVALAADLLAPESGTVLPSDPDATRMPDLAAMD